MKKRISKPLMFLFYALGFCWACFCAPGCASATVQAEEPEMPLSTEMPETRLASSKEIPAPVVSSEVYPKHYPGKIIAYHSLEALINSVEQQAREMESQEMIGAEQLRRSAEAMERTRQQNWRQFDPAEQELYYKYRRLNSR